MKLILITGNTGFIGKNILQSKTIKKHFIICINRKKSFKKKNFYNYNFKDFKKIKNFNIELLIHFASADPENSQPGLIQKKNAEIDKVLLFLQKKNNIKKIFFTSSNSIFENNKEKNIFSTTIPRPKNSYGRSKVKTELLIKKKFKSYVILRLPSIIGPGFSKGLIFRFLQKINRKQKIKIFNKDKKFNNIFDVKDMIKIIVRYLNSKENQKKILNICSINSITFYQMLKYLYKMKKKKMKIMDCGLSNQYKFFVWKEDVFLQKIKFKKIRKILSDNIK